jgi:glycosyltransferase involved in cell wall biosynthesis
MGTFTKALATRAGVPAARLITVPFPVSWRQFETEPVVATRPPGPFRIACVSRLIPDKGIDVLIDAVGCMERGKVEVRIAGEGAAHGDLERRAIAASGDIRFLGWIEPEQIPDLYRWADVCVLPSLVEEGFGMALVEAALFGCVPIGSNLGGIKDLIEDADTGFVFEPGDAAALESVLVNLMNAPDTLRVVGQRAQAKAMKYLAQRNARLKQFEMAIRNLSTL